MKSIFASVPITVKVNSLIVLVLVLGIGMTTLSLTASFSSTVESSNREALLGQSRSVYASIETLMMPGRADLATGLFKRFSADTAVQVAMFRPSGEEAFVDNSTIRDVNTRLKDSKFSERFNPPMPLTIEEQTLFKETVAHPERDEVFFTSVIDGRSYARLFKPMLNIPKCTTCHGPDHTIRGILDIRFDITRTMAAQQQATGLALGLFALTVLGSGLLLGRFMHRAVLRPVQMISTVCNAVSLGDFSPRVQLGKSDEIGRLGTSVNSMIDGLVERFKLAKYVSGTTMEGIRGSEESKRVERVLLFTDIRGFTSFSERNPPEKVVQALKYILTIQTDLIHKQGGDIDKFVGDEIMAIFDGKAQVGNALAAALAIQAALASTSEDLACGLRVGIGIHCGDVIQGMIGSSDRADFTVIGDNVNLAARLCSIAQAGEILISQQILDSLKIHRYPGLGQIKVRGPVRVQVKGKEGLQNIYRIRKDTP